jgi:hypothetical protein
MQSSAAAYLDRSARRDEACDPLAGCRSLEPARRNTVNLAVVLLELFRRRDERIQHLIGE